MSSPGQRVEVLSLVAVGEFVESSRLKASEAFSVVHRSLEFKLADAKVGLIKFASFLQQRHAVWITIPLAMEWAQQDKTARPAEWAKRSVLYAALNAPRPCRSPRFDQREQVCDYMCYVELEPNARRRVESVIDICGRKVKVYTRVKTQTVNICSSANIEGHYDYIVRLSPPFISTEVLLQQSFRSIQDVVRYLERHHSGEVERVPSTLASKAAQIRPNASSPDPGRAHSLIELFRSAEVNRFSSLATSAAALSESELLLKFQQQSKAAPYRGLYRSYFVGHTGITTSRASTNRREEHLAIALWRAYHETGFALPDGTILFPIDYQLPMKSHLNKANVGLGKIDLFCVESEGEPWICELKIHSVRNGRVETPLKAILEALAYCATLDPDMGCLSRESHDKKLPRLVNPTRPNLVILAPTEYWELCELAESRHCWRDALHSVRRRVELAFKIKVRFVRMDNCRWEMTASGVPQLIGSPVFDWAIPDAFASSPAMNLRRILEDWQIGWRSRGGNSANVSLMNSPNKPTSYVRELGENLFEPLSPRVKQQFIAGAGNELDAPDGKSGNMYAVYSSSALCVNLFHFWSRLLDEAAPNSKPSIDQLLAACGLPARKAQSIDFEVPNIVNPRFKGAPHLDVQISFGEGPWECAGIEAKFCEPYGHQKPGGLMRCYLRETALWRDWPNIRALAEKLSPEDLTHSHFHAAQLLKHLLALRKGPRKQNNRSFVLVYLWFDVPGAEEAKCHRQEIESFAAVLKHDGVAFVSRTYQQVFEILRARDGEPDSPQVVYLLQRYLEGSPRRDQTDPNALARLATPS